MAQPKPAKGSVIIPGNIDELYTETPVQVEITSLTPLMMNRMNAQTMQNITTGKKKSGGYNKTPREEAELVAYRNEDGSLYIQGVAVHRLLQERGRYHTIQGQKGKNVANLVPGGVQLPERLMMEEPVLVNGVWDRATWGPAMDFEVDTRTVVNPSTRKRNVRSRPRIDNWRLNFVMRVFTYSLNLDTVNLLLMEGGLYTGLGDFRPQCSGQYGKFKVTLWRPMPPRPISAEPVFVEDIDKAAK